MVEDDGAEVTTVVVCNEVLCSVGALQAACSNTLMLQQGLIQGKQHLQGETWKKQEVLLVSASTNSVFSALRPRRVCHKGVETVFLFKNIL